MNLFENPLVIAKHAAEREIRDTFQARYGSFAKCISCGANLGVPDETTVCCSPDWAKDRVRYVVRAAGYTPPPRHHE